MKRQNKLKWYKEEFENIHKKIKESGSLTHHDFLRIRNFKLQNSSPEDEKNIEKITKEAFNLAKQDKIQEAIKILLTLDGVAIPIASTILAMKFPEKFAIIDRRVITAIGKKEWLKKYLHEPSIYESYLKLLRQKAKDECVDLRTLERELYEKE